MNSTECTRAFEALTTPVCCKSTLHHHKREENPDPFLTHGHKNTLTQAVQRAFRDCVFETTPVVMKNSRDSSKANGTSEISTSGASEAEVDVRVGSFPSTGLADDMVLDTSL